jgi:hypothetical protein
MFSKAMQLIGSLFVASILLTSCYSHTMHIGEGAQGTISDTQLNHYVVYGLAPVGVSDTREMASGAKNYTIHTRHTFVNGLVNVLTLGLYTPTTTTVTR